MDQSINKCSMLLRGSCWGGLWVVCLWLGVFLVTAKQEAIGKKIERISGDSHWSFQPIQRPEVPAVKNKSWLRNPIDAFVLRKLESESIKPSGQADKVTLIRRLHLDLLGLPPSIEEVDAFVEDDSDDAYRKLVDRLLASEHFGERWGRHWLDLARYADSDGYEKDNIRPHAYRFRDWVIQAVNSDLPYDDFTIEQLAGDLLPDATESQKIATGFHRNTLTNREGGIDPKEDRDKQLVDRVGTTGAVWLGLTIACSQCHEHKYDPISQQEFYGLYAFFNNSKEKNFKLKNTPEELNEFEEKKSQHDEELREIEKQIDRRMVEIAGIIESENPFGETRGLEQEISWHSLKVKIAKSKAGADLTQQEDLSILASGKDPEKDTYFLEFAEVPGKITALALEVLPDDSLPRQGPGRANNGNFVVNKLKLVMVQDSAEKKQTLKPVNFKSAWANFSQKGWPVEHAIDGNRKTGWANDPNEDKHNRAVFILKDTLELNRSDKIRLMLEQNYGSQHTLGRFRILVTETPGDLVRFPPDIKTILLKSGDQRGQEEKDKLVDFYASGDEKWSALKEKIDEHKENVPKLPDHQAQTMIEDAPQQTHLHIRGDFLREGEPIEPHTLSVLPALVQRGESPDRLDLARWIMDAANPLTARVGANRIWEKLFGWGLVRMPGDFGSRGDKPTHPELLDWLACEYRRLGWSRKDMIRLIVDSATYRQRSRVRGELNELDPENLLLARQNRFRVEAEIVRDITLAAGGLLHPAIGGPGIKPHMPPDIAKYSYANSVKWKISPAPDRYRRGMYIHFQRTIPYPMLDTFDSPDSNTTCIRRNSSNTPLQALTLLNDPVFFEMAQAMTRRLLAEGPENDKDRLIYAFRLCLARKPAPNELASLLSLYKKQLNIFKDDPESAAQFVGTSLPDGTAVHTAAAWTMVSRTLMNLDEFITRE